MERFRKLKKAVLSLVLTISTMATFGMFNFVKAANDLTVPAYLGIELYRSSGYGYKQGDLPIYKIATYKSTDTTNKIPDKSRTIYCIKGGIGFGSDDAETGYQEKIVTYTKKYDLKNLSAIPSPYKDVLPTGENYNKLMWVLDHLYIMPENTQEDSTQARTAFLNGAIPDELYDTMIDDDIDAIQQLAVWNFTNPDANDRFHIESAGLKIAKEGEAFDSLFNIDRDRFNATKALLSYYVKNADANYSSPVIASDAKPITIQDNSDGKIQTIGDNYVAGPYIINKQLDIDYDVTATYNDGTITPTIGIKNSNGNIEATNKTIKELEGQEFYLMVPTSSNITQLKMQINGSYKVRKAWYLSAENPEVEQPVVLVNEDTQYFEDVVAARLEEKKTFDLSLRKFITKINGQKIEELGLTSRVPNVEGLEELKNGTANTAIYKQLKTPVKVDIGDIVTYTIRVYNEGELAGYATEITDYLPDQLEYILDDEINLKYGWKYDTENTHRLKTNYLSNADGTTSETPEENKLAAFDGTKLDYKDVQIRCKVVSTANMPKKITNIAEITGCKDEEGNVITSPTTGERDSSVKNVQIPADLPSYKDQEINRQDPTDPDYIPGQEDDDDFEKLLLKEFDLSLKKFITKVNDTEITNRAPQVDVTPLKGTGTTAKYTYQISPEKNPVVVENSDIVEYTIRIYNEGEANGYAEIVRDDIPAGLEFLPENATNIEYRWKMYDADGNETTDASKATTITTDYLSKAQEDATGRNNLLKAFEMTKTTLDYRDVKVAFKVIEPNSSKNTIVNHAQIAEDTGNDRDSTPDVWNEGEDDQDIEQIRLKDFDLALRKFVTKINSKEITDRIPQVDLSTLKGNGTTATYNHSKKPLSAYLGDVVEYTIRVYNEGDSEGYATEITDYLPKQLEFIKDNQTNIANNWKMYDANGNETQNVSDAVTIKSDKLKDEKIPAFDGDTLSYKEVKVVCKVVATDNMPKKITNIAEISKCENSNRIEVKGHASGDERDSNPNQVTVPTGTELENYKDSEINKDYVPGQEDDDDFEKLLLEEFDLSLRKFITAVNDTQIKDREPKVDVTPLKDGSGTTAKYEHSKEPVLVSNGNIVEYTIRVYNEGSVAGYAQEVKDDIPEGLEFLPENETNTKYRWVMLDKDGMETTKVEDAQSIVTDYLSIEQEKTAGENLIKAFDPTTMDTLDYKDVKVAFKVVEPATSDRIVINKAQISKECDEDENDVKDRDSTPDEWIEGEDDQDIEKVKVQYFDLSLRKWVTQSIVIEDGQEKVTETGHTAEDDPEAVAKVDLKKSKINNVIVKFRFKIRVKNEGTIAGYVKEIKDYIPDGLKFLEEDNPLWKKVDEKTITTDQCKDVLLKPGDTTEVEVLLTWINGEDNMGVMDNWAEISKDYNEYGSPDIDSTPDNNKKGEDDIDDAPVMVTVQTGEVARYTGIAIVVLTILTTGVVLIKKYVLR
ncbi:conserved repeat domain protein [Clostridium sp. CAG:780]|nr:conserved repeat domain protein [Clostridium sp. CAG:780]